MRQILALISVLFLLVSCVQHAEERKEVEVFERKDFDYEIKHAQGFNIQQSEDALIITTHNLPNNEEWEDQLIAPYNENALQDQSGKIIDVHTNRICCQSSTHLPFLDQLKQLDKVKGLCGMQYVANQKLVQQLEENQAVEICIGEKSQAEEILTQDPDLYFVYPFESEQVEELEKQGVKTFMVAEYLETEPLARLEWIKVFGAIFDRYQQAEGYFDQVESLYEVNQQNKKDPDKKFFMNLPFGDSWNSPSSNSLIVNLCEDAGLSYYFDDELGTENVVRSKEQMWQVGAEVPYWVIIANRPENFTLQDLVSEEEVYKTFRSVKEGHVIFCNTSTTDYFTYGILEPHILLKELVNLVYGHPITSEKYFTLLD